MTLALALRPACRAARARCTTATSSPAASPTLEKVRLGGHDQWIEIRGANARQPGPALLSRRPRPERPPLLARAALRPDRATSWSSAGTSAAPASPTRRSTRRPLTLDRAVADTIELTDLPAAALRRPKIYLLGESWGSTLGVLAAQRRPDLYARLRLQRPDGLPARDRPAHLPRRARLRRAHRRRPTLAATLPRLRRAALPRRLRLRLRDGAATTSSQGPTPLRPPTSSAARPPASGRWACSAPSTP